MAAREVPNLKLLLLRDENPAYVIGAIVGIDPASLSRYARGAAKLEKHQHIIALCSYFDVDENYLRGYDGHRFGENGNGRAE